MDKLKHIPLALLCLYGVKSLFITPSPTVAGLCVLFGALAMFYDASLQAKHIKQMNTKIDEMQKKVKELTDLSESLTTNVSSMKIAQTYKRS